MMVVFLIFFLVLALNVHDALFLQEKFNVSSMGHQVIIFDFSLIRGLWEARVKKNKERQRKEKERLEKSSLEK